MATLPATPETIEQLYGPAGRGLNLLGELASLARCGAVHAVSDVEEFGTASDKRWEIPPPTSTTLAIGVTPEHVAWRIWKLLLHPRRVIYVPRWLRIVPWVELSFGWLEDLIGMLMLRRKQSGRG